MDITFWMGLAVNSPVRTDSFPSAVSLWRERPRRLLQDHDSLMSRVQTAVSVAVSCLILLQLASWLEGEVRAPYRYLAIIVVLSMVGVYKWRGVFRRFDGSLKGCARIGKAWFFTVGFVFGVLLLMGAAQDFSGTVLLAWAGLGLVSQVAVYSGFNFLSPHLRKHARPACKAVVIGTGPLAMHIISSVNRNNWINDVVVGSVEEEQHHNGTSDLLSVPILGDLASLQRVIDDHGIGRVYIALPIHQLQKIEMIHQQLRDRTLDIVWVPDIFSMRLLNHSVKELNGLPLIALSETPLVSETYAMLKDAMDKVIAFSMLCVLSPLMLTIAFLVWQSSPGPIIFRQKRHGWDGRIIEIWKFRSMKMHDDAVVTQAQRNDGRVTRIGRFIRKTSIDELPQLINVLQGRMSLVGPRPHAVEHNNSYSALIPAYMLRHRIKPGITGLAQVNGLRGETETLDKMVRRVEYDIRYINNWSIWMDIAVLFKTPFTLFSKNIY